MNDASSASRAHCRGGLSALFRGEMARHRAAVEALLAEAQCDHLIFCGANRFGSIVQCLTQWPVTAEAVGVFTPGERDALFVQWINHQPQAALLADKADVAWGGEVLDCLGGRRAGPSAARAGRIATSVRSRPSNTPSSPRSSARRRISTAPTRGTAAGQIGRGDRLAAHRRALHRSRHGGLRDGLDDRIDRARTRRSGRARLRQAWRRQFHSLHRRHLHARAQCGRAAPVSLHAPRAKGRRGRGGDHRDVLGLSGAGAALVCAR